MPQQASRENPQLSQNDSWIHHISQKYSIPMRTEILRKPRNHTILVLICTHSISHSQLYFKMPFLYLHGRWNKYQQLNSSLSHILQKCLMKNLFHFLPSRSAKSKLLSITEVFMLDCTLNNV